MKRIWLVFEREMRLQWGSFNVFLSAMFFNWFLIFIAGFAYQNSPVRLSHFELSAIFWVVSLLSVQLAILQISWRSDETERELALLPVSPTVMFITRFCAVFSGALTISILSGIIFVLFFNVEFNSISVLFALLIILLTTSAQVVIGIFVNELSEATTRKTRFLGVILAVPILFPVFAAAVSATTADRLRTLWVYWRKDHAAELSERHLCYPSPDSEG